MSFLKTGGPALLLLGATAAQAQTSPVDVAAIKQTVNLFFEGLREADSAKVHRTLAPGVVLHTIENRKDGPTLGQETVAELLKAIGTPHAQVWDERIRFEQVLIDGNLASVWAPYQFYIGSKFSHCGYNSFQLVKLAGGWKIAHVIDTRRKENCP